MLIFSIRANPKKGHTEYKITNSDEFDLPIPKFLCIFATE